MSKNILIVLAILIVIGVVVVVVIKNTGTSDLSTNLPENQGKIEKEKVSVPIETVDKDQLPKEFPSGIPLESGAEVVMNYNATNADGDYQASREFISKKSIAENFALYQKILKDDGWSNISVQENVSAGSLIFATKGNYNLNIRIYKDTSGKVRVAVNNIVKK